MEGGWPGMIVEDGNLTVQIAALRKALGRWGGRARRPPWAITFGVPVS